MITKCVDILVLTAHSTHDKGESIYELLTQMSLNSQCNSIWVATRDDDRNKPLFSEIAQDKIYAKKVDSDYEYSEFGEWYSSSESKSLSDFSVVFLRIDRPLTDNHLVFFSEIFKNSLVINRPEGIIETDTKSFLLELSEHCPEIKLCKTILDIQEEIKKYPIVLKPLRGYGGIGIMKVDGNRVFVEDTEYSFDSGMKEIEDALYSEGALLSMRYLPNIKKGDKRVVVVGDTVIGATLRIPGDSSWLCNVKQGGQAIYAEVDENEHEIAKSISSVLRKKGIFIYGFDTLEDEHGIRKLSEINVLNVGGLLQIQELSGDPVIKTTSDLIFEYIHYESENIMANK